MEKRHAVMVASRAIAFYLLVWALDAASYLPSTIFAFWRHRADESVLSGPSYFHNYYLIQLGFGLLRFLTLLIAAIVMYRCGKRVQEYFLPNETGNRKLET